MAIEALVPPMSAEPSRRFVVPSSLTLMVQAEGSPMLNQKPSPTPRPRLGPSRGASNGGGSLWPP